VPPDLPSSRMTHTSLPKLSPPVLGARPATASRPSRWPVSARAQNHAYVNTHGETSGEAKVVRNAPGFCSLFISEETILFYFGQKLLLRAFLTRMGNGCACWRRPDDILHKWLAVLQTMLPPRGVVQTHDLQVARGSPSDIAVHSL
jgi:hypothetical protein